MPIVQNYLPNMFQQARVTLLSSLSPSPLALSLDIQPQTTGTAAHTQREANATSKRLLHREEEREKREGLFALFFSSVCVIVLYSKRLIPIDDCETHINRENTISRDVAHISFFPALSPFPF